jgi:CoA-dependent NAD(P)H sulfur oxidoreductase
MRLVVVGGVAAGLSAASRARRLDPELEILVLEKGYDISYGACGLPYYIEGRAEDLSVYSADFFRRERKIEIRTAADVVSVLPTRRELTLSGGERITYDRLILATGARPNPPPEANRPVFCLHTFEDGRRLKDFLGEHRPARAAVMGGGYIGLEAAEALRTQGWRVTLFQESPYLLHRADAELTALLVAHLKTFRIDLRLGQRYDGSRYDLIVSATGLKPNAEIAAAAGIELGTTGAIRVSDRMETSANGIYAAGDCVELTHLVTGRPVWIALGTHANKAGRVAGANAAGGDARFPGVVGTSIVRVCGLGVALTGLSTEEARLEGFDVISASASAFDKAKYFRGRRTRVELTADRRTGRLLGGSVIGEDGAGGRINVIATALHRRMRVDEFEYLDLAYAPPFAPVYDPLLVTAHELLKKL